MSVSRRIFVSIVRIAVLATLSACATTERLDHYADRVTTYNKEAELAQDRAILLNVLRASKRRPLSFFELQTVSASGTPSGQVGFSIPLAQNGGAAASTFSPQLNLSSGPTVTASYIDTQEFYQGILKPIPMNTIDYFVQRGISENLLFNLFFFKATVHVHVDAKVGARAGLLEHVFINYPGRDEALDGYQRLVTKLLNNGLTTGAEDSVPSNFGPPLTAGEVADPAMLAKLTDAKLQLTAVNWCDLTSDERRDIIRRSKLAATDADACGGASASVKGDQPKRIPPALRKAAQPAFAAAGYFRVQQKAGGSHKLCFSGTSHPPGAYPGSDDDSGCEQASAMHSMATVDALTVHALGACALTDALPSLKAELNAAQSCSSASYDVAFTPRSTYGVIYYLGEVVRRKLDPDDKATTMPRVVMVRHARADLPIAAERCPTDVSPASAAPDGAGSDPSTCRPVFFLGTARTPEKAYLSVNYDGETYVVPDRSDRAGMSNEVLDIVSELLALNRSSKDAPTSNLVTVVGAH